MTGGVTAQNSPFCESKFEQTEKEVIAANSQVSLYFLKPGVG